MRKTKLLLVFLWCALLCGTAYSQASFARVSGTVQDSSNALVPGASVTATEVNNGVVVREVTNETGTYNFVSLLPGSYKLSVALPGFQTQTLTDLKFGAEQYRYNFTLRISPTATSVEVVESGATLLKTSSSSVGEVLSQQQVSNLPLVGNNVLQLIQIMAGVSNADQVGTTFGGELVQFAGVSARDITTVRDGLMVQDVRYATGITSNTFINPDLVGEIRLILAPVDAEIGRGNGSVQITTRSGTNKYTGAVAWFARNSAFNANTFERNRATPAGLRPYTNNQQVTGSFGGPIIRNKTFFYALYDQTATRSRSEVTSTVLTPCARNGIFRYFDFWNNGNVNTTLVTGALGTLPARPVVDLDGTPVTPTANPVFATIPAGAPAGTTSGGAYTGQLRYISVFGPLLNTPAKADCSDAQVNAAQRWDTYRVQRDPSGYVDRMLKYMPQANNYTTGDGLNTASIRWLRGNKGGDNLFGVGQDAGVRKQVNIKIDQNFNQNHKANVGMTYERDNSSDSQPSWPGSFAGPAYRRPRTLTSSFTSTLSQRTVNEARFGLRMSGSNSTAPYDYAPNLAELNQLLPPAVNGVRILPRMGSGSVSFQSTQPMALNQGAAWSYTLRDRSPIYTFTDNLSWTKSAHSFRIGGELRLVRSRSETNGDGTTFTSVVATGGNSPGAPVRTNAVDAISATNPTMPFIRSTDEGRARDLLTFLSGSLSSVSEWFFMMDPKKTDAFEDYRSFPFRIRETRRKEISAFFKDDWKIKRDLTLNLGVRYEYYGVPFIASGLTIAPIGGADALFGISGRDFSGWLQAPKTGAGALNYDPNLLTQVNFVGPNSQNPGVSALPHDYNNIGPAIGFAWSVPWFGEGKTSVRGGYQLTFQAGQNASTIEGAISNPPGSTLSQTYSPTAGDVDPYLDLTDLGVSAPVPLRTSFTPVSVPPVINHGGGAFGNINYTAYDKDYVSPYIQNFTLTVTRNVSRRLTAEVRYVGNMAVKQIRTINLNTSNFLRNPLFPEFDSIRKGTDATPMLNQMLTGINLCFTNAGCATQYVNASGQTVTAQYGAIGTTTADGTLQTPAYQMRLHPSYNGGIANGDYLTVSGTLYDANGNITGPAGSNGRIVRNSGLFPENFLVANPQFRSANYTTNFGHSNYHSLQAQLTFRPIAGISGTGTYTWSKGMSLSNALADPLNRSEVVQTGQRPHEFRANGQFELPIGPNKLFFGTTSGWIARAIERWQTSFIVNMSAGSWSNVTAVNRMYGTGVPDVVYPIDFRKAKSYAWGNERNGALLNADYFGGQFVNVTDPQCGLITNKQSLTQAVGATTARCTLRALAVIVPEGTEGSFVLNDNTGRTARIVLQNALPGTKGNLGTSKVRGFGTISFDASASKTFRVSESKSVQLRIDSTNVLNHPSPGGITLDINGNNTFGNVSTKSGGRTVQGQLRVQF